MQLGQSQIKICDRCSIKEGTEFLENISRFSEPWEKRYCKECKDIITKETKEKLAILRINERIPLKYINIETDKKSLFDIKPNESLFITGNPGSGKTVYSCSLAKKYIHNGQDIVFINFPKFIMKLQSLYRNDKDNPFDYAENIAIEVKPLFIDDLGAEKVTDYVKQIVYFILNEREQYQRTTVITSNFSLSELDEQFDSRISSRIAGMCKIIKLNGKDRRLDKDNSTIRTT